MHRRRWGVVAAMAAPMLATGIVTVAAPGTAAALNVVAVTATADVVDGADGVVSLREAFTVANSDGDDTEIVLVADALYRLCDDDITATSEDANADGDLDHTAPDLLLITGNGAEIRNTCPGERVLHSLHVDGDLELRDLLIAGGDVGGDPGSGLLSAGDVTITGTTFTDNTGSNAAEIGDQFTGGADAVVTTSEFNDNGGGVRVNYGTATITDSEFVFNQGPGITADHTSLTLSGSLVRENTSGVNGIDAGISVSGSIVRDNASTGVRTTGNAPTGYPLTVIDSIVDENGNGGIDCSFCTSLTITGSTIANNHPANGFGGSGVQFRQNLPGATVTIESSTISGNLATEHGGGVLLRADDGVVADVTITGSTITANRTGLFGDGGGIHAASVDLAITGSHIDGNVAAPDDVLAGGSGGAIAMIGGGSLTVSGSTMDGNRADVDGGGVSLLDVTAASFATSSISDNVADGSGGGGFSAAGAGATYSFVGTTVDGNTAQLAGGGIAVNSSSSGVDVLLDGSTVSGNVTEGSNGGGVWVNSPIAALTIRNSTVSGNSAPFIAGGVGVIGTGAVTLEHATIVSNSAPDSANLRYQTGDLTSFGSVVALAQGGGADCGTFSAATVSLGYNASGADTCGFGAGTGDQPNVGNPLLGALVSLGGPTAVRPPLGGSPLVSAIPPAGCALEVDQVGSPRPLGAGCEIGAVELVTGGLAAVDDLAEVPRNPRRPAVIRVLGNDYDPAGRLRPSTLRIVDRPEHGVAVALGNGKVLYRPTARFSGTDSFTYEVCATVRVRHRQTKVCVRGDVVLTVGSPPRR